ncbi:MAG TPA: S8 family serine peptidase [Pyrinomonadaceae bacterium]|nr:S8 family serine peptidase [Pyrinomonadaceae bacterium]
MVALALLLAVSLNLLPAGRAVAESGRSHRESLPAHQQKEKVSPDLREQARAARRGERVRVVVQHRDVMDGEQEEEIRRHGGSVKEKFESLGMRTVELPAQAVEALAAREDVEFVSPDREMVSFGHLKATTGGLVQNPLGKGTLDGNGVAIAVFDSGVDAGHASFLSGKTSRVVKSVDFTGEGVTADAYGHGTHVAGAAASSNAVSRFENGVLIDYQGLAPAAKIVSLRVLNREGRGTLSGFLRAVDWLMANRATYNVRVANMSLGMPAIDSYKTDPACRAVRRLVNAGVVTVVAAGNNGRDASGGKVYGQIHSPGNEPSAITVGAANTFGTDARSDDGVATYSSRGPTRSYSTDLVGVRHYDNLVKPDLVAPGNKIVAAQSLGNRLIAQYPQMDPGVNSSFSPNSRMMYMSGSSVAAPVVAGAAAQMLQMHPRLTPNLVKMVLMYTAQQLKGYNALEQGAGLVNTRAAVDLARLIRTDLTATTPLGAPLLTTTAVPNPQTLVAGQYARWGEGVIAGHTYLTGTDLITKYQKIYSSGTLMNDAVLVADTNLLGSNPATVTAGVLVADSILTSNGIVIAEGSFFLSTAVLMGDGVLVPDGLILSDNGVVMNDAVLVADGDMGLTGGYSSVALSAMVNGDDTTCMR